MKLELSAKHRLIQRVSRQFAKDELQPIASEIDRQASFPPPVLEKMRSLQYFGLLVPKRYGGAGIDTLGYALVVEEVSKVCAALGLMVAVHNGVVVLPILRFGREDQREDLLTPLAKGERIGAFCLTEPNAGSDPSRIEATAVLREDRFTVRGNKSFVTNGGMAGIGLVFCRTGLTDRRREISVLLCHAETPGIVRGPVEELCGMRGNPVCSWILSDCSIPRENLLGRPGEGLRIALDALDRGRIGIGAQALGIGQACLDASIHYARQREQFGTSIGRFQMIQGLLADMAVEMEAARFLVYRAAGLAEGPGEGSLPSAMAKLLASETAMRAALRGVQIHGGYGYVRSFPIERFFRDAKATEIYEGTSEIQRLVIAREVLGLKGGRA